MGQTRAYNKKILDATEKASTFRDASYNVQYNSLVNFHAVWTDETPSAHTFVDGDVSVADDEITETAHGMETGLKIQLSTTGVLPTGLSAATDYYVIKVDADTYKLATSQANADAGTQIDITAASGGGTHTTTPQTTLAGTVTIQATDDDDNVSTNDTNWEIVTDSTGTAVTQTISAAGSYMFNMADVGWKYTRLKFTVTEGQLGITAWLNAKGAV